MARRTQITAYPRDDEEKALIEERAEVEGFESVSKYILYAEREYRDQQTIERETKKHHVEDRLRDIAEQAREEARTGIREEMVELRELVKELAAQPSSAHSPEPAESDGGHRVDDDADSASRDDSFSFSGRNDGGDWRTGGETR